jgi:DNA-binding transcriptional MerR regulator/methylmalonyl-CoA mutase cobalamin-binding subunit
MNTLHIDQDLLTIGDLARISGLSVLRIRAWENRHNEPGSLRLPSGHRRYTRQHLLRLLLLSQLMDLGHRIGDLKGKTDEQLTKMLEHGAKNLPVEKRPTSPKRWEWRQAVAASDAMALMRLIESASTALGTIEFLETELGPFVADVGTWWANGEITIAQEHFASAVVEEFLAKHRWAVHLAPDAPRVVFCTLPSEPHTLGLQMAALVAAQNGLEVVYLGRRLPNSEIPQAVRQARAKTLCLSFSSIADPIYTAKEVELLRKKVPSYIDIVLGGSGAPEKLTGVTCYQDFRAFAAWCRKASEKGA